MKRCLKVEFEAASVFGLPSSVQIIKELLADGIIADDIT
jgi:hypothetical protein